MGFNFHSRSRLMQKYFFYRLLILRLQKRLSEISDQVAQINKEEELFQMTPTTYPQLDTINSAIEPYQRLFTSIFKWQRTEKKLMDGAFLELNAEDTQAEVICLSNYMV